MCPTKMDTIIYFHIELKSLCPCMPSVCTSCLGFDKTFICNWEYFFHSLSWHSVGKNFRSNLSTLLLQNFAWSAKTYNCKQIGFFTNTQKWQYWHYCQLCLPIYIADWRLLRLFAGSTTRNDRPFSCPIVYMDIFVKCYFVPWHLQQFIIQATAFTS